jgi:hypothetical protein
MGDSKDTHDLMRCRACLRQPPARRLAKTVRTTPGRQASIPRPIHKKVVETPGGKRLTLFGQQEGKAIAWRMLNFSCQSWMNGNE